MAFLMDFLSHTTGWFHDCFTTQFISEKHFLTSVSLICGMEDIKYMIENDMVMKVMEFPADFCNKERTKQEIIELC